MNKQSKPHSMIILSPSPQAGQKEPTKINKKKPPPDTTRRIT